MLVLALMVFVGLLLLFAATTASASKQIYNYFGTSSGFGFAGGEFRFPLSVAINSSGAGPAEVGDVYVVDGPRPSSGLAKSNRIQRFARDAEGELHFVSAWGAGVQSGGTDYEICTVAASCHQATPSGGNGTPAGNGALRSPTGIAVDQDTGEVYVVDSGNSRVNVYEGDGTFLRSFGFDVVASGPGSVPGPEEEQKLLVKADAGRFSIAFRGPATGPRGVGGRNSGQKALRTFEAAEGIFTVGMGISGEGIPPNTTIFKVGSSSLTLSQAANGDTINEEPLYGDNFPFNASATEVESALNALPTVGPLGGSISVTRLELSSTEFEYGIRFGGALAGEDVPDLVPTKGGLALGGGNGSATVSTMAHSGSLETCVAAAGDICKAGDAGAQLGEIAPRAFGIAVSPPDGDPANGRVYVADAGDGSFGNERIDIYDLDGSSPASIGEGVFAGNGIFSDESPASLAVDSRGIVYASNGDAIERYDSENANGTGVGFLSPIEPAVSEVQRITVDASAGQYRLSFGGDTTEDLAYDSSAATVQAELESLPSVGSGGVRIQPSFNKVAEPYLRVEFDGSLFGQDVEPLTCTSGATPLSGGNGAVPSTPVNGGNGKTESQQLTVNATAGQFRLKFYATSGTGTTNSGSPIVNFVSTYSGVFKPGEPITGKAIPPDTTILSVEGNQLTLSANATANGGQALAAGPVSTTPDLSFDGSAAEVEAAINALPSLGSLGGSVVVSGGPGDATGSSPYAITYGGTLANRDVSQLEALAGSTPLSGGNGCSIFTATNGKAGSPPSPTLAIAPDSDGPGPDVDVLYAASGSGREFISKIGQFGPLNGPGLSVPPTEFDAIHGGASRLGAFTSGLAIDEASGDLYVTNTTAKGNEAHGVYVLGEIGPPPAASLDSVDQITATTVRVNGTINPQGPAKVSYRVEYSLDGDDWLSTSSIAVGDQVSPQSVSTTLDPPPAGLAPNTLYHVRLIATKPGNEPVVTSELTFITLPEVPSAELGTLETTGSPVRTATTALLSGRVNPRNSATTYHFEYGDLGSCDLNPCQSTESQSAGDDDEVKLVAQRVEGLEPGTTYHYRVVAENVSPESPGYGEDMTVTTRASEGPLDHGHLPGPPGSDRAYEQVIVPDTGGNPLLGALGFSDDGNRALYRIFGGTPISDSGTAFGLYFAERTPSGWQTRRTNPPREELVGPSWASPMPATPDLSTILGINREGVVTGDTSIWRLDPTGQPTKLFEPTVPQEPGGELFSYGLSEDGRRAVVVLQGGELDPAYPEASGRRNAYELSSGTPVLLNLMPGNTVPACGLYMQEAESVKRPSQATHWTIADGSRLFFSSQGGDCSNEPQLYVREIEAGQTELVSGPALSGPSCGAGLIKATPGAAFFWTRSRLAVEDSSAASCNGASGADVYRFSLADGSLECVTCVVKGLNANVGSGRNENAIAEDGSRVYFTTKTQLLTGAPPSGQLATYRVHVASGELAYVGPVKVGELTSESQALSADGTVLLFRSDDPRLDPLGGLQNGGTAQYYLYDDRDRSLICASCPQDGAAPEEGVQAWVASPFDDPAMGLTPLSADGRVFAFSTPNSLLAPDQNTAGSAQQPEAGDDVYEWRDGRLLLVTDGLLDWPTEGPEVEGVSPSGRDVYFAAATQYTQDAIDGYLRLYDARIGGGFEFSTPPPPCPLEVCQGTPKGAPIEQEAGSANFAGPGNQVIQARKKQSKKKKGKKGQRKAHKKGKRKSHKPRRKASQNGRNGR